ncbi:MAG: hypothetical protein JWN65_2921 [Solirubrobacterales bacterium]|nr:hypothetical protein [Solirubrobacterales bacterium]
MIALALAATIYLVTGGHVLFLPLLLFLPLGIAGRRHRRRSPWR